jgi:diguanylate cyclase (GGDEF)-like protein
LVGRRVAVPDNPTLLVLILAALVVAAAYRPWGFRGERPGLGAGLFLLPAGLHLLGSAATGWAVLLAHPLLAATRILLGRTASGSGLAGGAGRDTAAVLVAAAVHQDGAGPGDLRGLFAAGVAFLAVRAGLELALRRIGHETPLRPAADARELGAESGAWVLGTLYAGSAAMATPSAVYALLLVVCVLGFEATRQLARRERTEDSRLALLDLGGAGSRLVQARPGMEEVAQRVFLEARRVLPAAWIELTLDRPTMDGGSVWHQGPRGPLAPEPAVPPDHPPAQPGIHRRRRWRVLDRRLEAADDTLGCLRLWYDVREANRETVALFDSLLPQLASLVHRARLDEEASRDPLTGAALRRVLDDALVDAFSRSRSSGGSVSVILVDLDFFKRINDRWGHPAGDEALRAVARVLAANLRDGDLCARYGGEEFTLLLEGLDGAASLAVAERLRSQVERLRVEHEGERLPLTLSAGVASFPELQIRNGAELVELADAALYEAKRLGRNGCLLHRGRGRFEDPRGRVVETEGSGDDPPPQAPRLFA